MLKVKANKKERIFFSMISVQEALDIIINEVKPLEKETVDIFTSLWRVVADNVVAGNPNPPWDNSAMDGYAVRSADLKGASESSPVTLKVAYDLPAGSVPEGPVEEGSAVRIMTGAPVPEGADSVVMVEKTEGKDGDVLVKAETAPGENVRKKGEDFDQGDVVIRAGTVVRPPEISMLATIGSLSVSVFRRPKVGVISTGDELVDVGTPTPPGKIADSNGYTLSALVAETGSEALQYGIAQDNKESLEKRLSAAATQSDCIITSGGVSVGDYDLVKDVLSGMGSTMRFWKVAMKPGKPLAFGMIEGKPLFGLPGNPISSMVTFEQFVRPVLLKLAGRKAIFRNTFKATLTEGFKTRPGRMTFFRAVLRSSDEGLTVEPLTGQGSGTVSTMVRANCFIIVPAEASGFSEGDTVRVQPFDPSVFMRDTLSY